MQIIESRLRGGERGRENRGSFSSADGDILACDAGAVVMRHAADGSVLDVGR